MHIFELWRERPNLLFCDTTMLSSPFGSPKWHIYILIQELLGFFGVDTHHLINIWHGLNRTYPPYNIIFQSKTSTSWHSCTWWNKITFSRLSKCYWIEWFVMLHKIHHFTAAAVPMTVYGRKCLLGQSRCIMSNDTLTCISHRSLRTTEQPIYRNLIWIVTETTYLLTEAPVTLLKSSSAGS